MPVSHASPVLSAADRDAAASVQALRAALRRAEVEAVQSVRWLAPRPPGERDLFSDLAAAEGLETAVRRLSRFWRRADVKLEHVRVVDALEAEVYERLLLPGESLPIVSLVRRASADASWRVVCTNEAHDERLTLWMPALHGGIDDVAWSRTFAARFGESGELIMDGLTGVLGDPDHGWLAHVRGPFRPRTWPEALTGEDHVVELTALLVPDREARAAQLAWALQAALVFLEQLGSSVAYLPVHGKLAHREALLRAAEGTLTAEQALRFWARLSEVDGHVVTSGLRHLGLPEVEARATLFDTPSATERVVAAVGAKLIEMGSPDALHGTDLVLGSRTFLVVPGRRGPRRGRTHGRWGALALVEDDRARRGSRTRLRLPQP
jgi:hypothetical protein